MKMLLHFASVNQCGINALASDRSRAERIKAALRKGFVKLVIDLARDVFAKGREKGEESDTSFHEIVRHSRQQRQRREKQHQGSRGAANAPRVWNRRGKKDASNAFQVNYEQSWIDRSGHRRYL